MFRHGLVSITFRKLAVPDIIALCARNGLELIEWGGDIHVPHGDLAKAREVRERTRDAGLAVAAYGSYYRLGVSGKEGLSLESVIATAVELGAPTIRVWAGNAASADAGETLRDEVARDALRAAELAAPHGISICYEYHGGTLTDSIESTRDLLDAARHPALFTLWQPARPLTPEQRLESLRDVLPELLNVHVYHWDADGKRRPLSEGTSDWEEYLSILRQTGRDHSLLLEFVRDDSPAAFEEDARTLLGWINNASGE